MGTPVLERTKAKRRAIGRAAGTAPATPAASPEVMVDALFADTMRRYPKTMARLAE